MTTHALLLETARPAVVELNERGYCGGEAVGLGCYNRVFAGIHRGQDGQLVGVQRPHPIVVANGEGGT